MFRVSKHVGLFSGRACYYSTRPPIKLIQTIRGEQETQFQFTPESKDKIAVHSIQRDKFSVKTKLINFFFPNGYPSSVNKDYWRVQRFWNLQWAASSAIVVFTTQSLLSSVGVGSTAALPISATINWVLKDVLACVGIMVVAKKASNYFDANLKRCKFVADSIIIFGYTIELIVQLFPKYFIVLASLSTFLKAVSGMINGSTKANVNVHFARESLGKNLGDVTAKGQSQGVFSYVIGLFYGIGIVKLNEIFVFSPTFLICHFGLLLFTYLFSGYKLLSNLHLHYLNDQRGRLVIESYLSKISSTTPLTDYIAENSLKDSLDILTPEETAKQEVYVKGCKPAVPVYFGASIDQLADSYDELHAVFSHSRKDDNSHTEKYLINQKNGKIFVAFEKTANEVDYFRAFFHSQVFTYLLKQQPTTQADHHSIWKTSYLFLGNNFPHFIESLKRTNWESNYISIFQPSENIRYSFSQEENLLRKE